MTDDIQVEVVYALPQEQAILSLKVPPGTTAAQAIELSGVLKKHPEIDLARNKIGIFGKLIKPETALREKDRVEIYRPLIADAKEIRKQRAAEGKVMKKEAGTEAEAAE